MPTCVIKTIFKHRQAWQARDDMPLQCRASRTESHLQTHREPLRGPAARTRQISWHYLAGVNRLTVYSYCPAYATNDRWRWRRGIQARNARVFKLFNLNHDGLAYFVIRQAANWLEKLERVAGSIFYNTILVVTTSESCSANSSIYLHISKISKRLKRSSCKATRREAYAIHCAAFNFAKVDARERQLRWN